MNTSHRNGERDFTRRLTSSIGYIRWRCFLTNSFPTAPRPHRDRIATPTMDEIGRWEDDGGALLPMEDPFPVESDPSRTAVSLTSLLEQAKAGTITSAGVKALGDYFAENKQSDLIGTGFAQPLADLAKIRFKYMPCPLNACVRDCDGASWFYLTETTENSRAKLEVGTQFQREVVPNFDPLKGMLLAYTAQCLVRSMKKAAVREVLRQTRFVELDPEILADVFRIHDQRIALEQIAALQTPQLQAFILGLLLGETMEDAADLAGVDPRDARRILRKLSRRSDGRTQYRTAKT